MKKVTMPDWARGGCQIPFYWDSVLAGESFVEGSSIVEHAIELADLKPSVSAEIMDAVVAGLRLTTGSTARKAVIRQILPGLQSLRNSHAVAGTMASYISRAHHPLHHDNLHAPNRIPTLNAIGRQRLRCVRVPQNSLLPSP